MHIAKRLCKNLYCLLEMLWQCCKNASGRAGRGRAPQPRYGHHLGGALSVLLLRHCSSEEGNTLMCPVHECVLCLCYGPRSKLISGSNATGYKAKANHFPSSRLPIPSLTGNFPVDKEEESVCNRLNISFGQGRSLRAGRSLFVSTRRVHPAPPRASDCVGLP